MSKPKFTPGPWELFWGGEMDVQIAGAAELVIATRSTDENPLEFIAPTKPDAHLIVAAPDLYKEVEKGIQFCQAIPDNPTAPHLVRAVAGMEIERKRALLARARGEASDTEGGGE